MENINKIIFRYLNDKKYIVLKDDINTLFLNGKGDEYAQIGLKNNGICYIYYKLIDEISLFFYLDKSDSERIIGKWVENTLQTEVIHTVHLYGAWNTELRIPYKLR